MLPPLQHSITPDFYVSRLTAARGDNEIGAGFLDNEKKKSYRRVINDCQLDVSRWLLSSRLATS